MLYVIRAFSTLEGDDNSYDSSDGRNDGFDDDSDDDDDNNNNNMIIMI